MAFIRLQLRRDTAANWTSANPTLAEGEIGIETDTEQFKIGNGSDAWDDLIYAGIQGDTGPAGADGKTILSGAVDPTTEGVDGDFYINTATSTLFGPKASGTWPSGVLLIGADGADGVDGVDGVGVPVGGTTGQALIKSSNTDYATEWGTVASSPGGSDTQVQFNDGGSFGGDAGLTFNKTSKAITLGGATVTTSSPVIDAAQTWNAVGTTFTGLKFNATDTASAAGSLLIDLQVGGTSRFSFVKSGNMIFGGTSGNPVTLVPDFTNGAMQVNFGGNVVSYFGALGVFNKSDAPVAWTSSSINAAGTRDTFLTRRGAANLRFGAADAAAPVAQTLSVQSVVAGTTNTAGANLTITGSQGTGTGAGGSIIFQVAPAGSSGTAQNSLVTFLEATPARAFNLYNTTDVTTNFERGKVSWESNILRIGTEKGGSGTARALELQTDGATRLTIAATGNATFSNDIISSVGGGFAWTNRSKIWSPANGRIQLTTNAGNDFDYLIFGSATSSFPALKRSTTSLQARLADDSAFTNIQGKLTTETAYTAGAPTATGYLVLYDSNGTAYKVAAEAL